MPLGAGNPAGVVALGYALSSEELGPQELVDNAVAAERVGFSYALVSDHYHPWLDVQGESPFVWSTVGALSQATRSLAVGTAYAVWGGIGALGTVIVGIAWYQEPASLPRLLLILGVVACIAGLKITGAR